MSNMARRSAIPPPPVAPVLALPGGRRLGGHVGQLLLDLLLLSVLVNLLDGLGSSLLAALHPVSQPEICQNIIVN